MLNILFSKLTVKVIEELGLDMYRHASKHVDTELPNLVKGIK